MSLFVCFLGPRENETRAVYIARRTETILREGILFVQSLAHDLKQQVAHSLTHDNLSLAAELVTRTCE